MEIKSAVLVFRFYARDFCSRYNRAYNAQNAPRLVSRFANDRTKDSTKPDMSDHFKWSLSHRY